MTVQYINWIEFEKDCLDLASLIKLKYSGLIKFDTLVAVNRGGIFVAGMLSYILGIKNVKTITLSPIENYLNTGCISFTPATSLILDTINDTGDTQSILFEFLKKRGTINPLDRLAVVYQKENTTMPITNVGKYMDPNVWLKFPWEKYENE